MKFALLVWVGPGVSAMKKAKLSTDKGFVKQVFVVSIALIHSTGLSHTYYSIQYRYGIIHFVFLRVASQNF